jgi:Na+/alanine symporter
MKCSSSSKRKWSLTSTAEAMRNFLPSRKSDFLILLVLFFCFARVSLFLSSFSSPSFRYCSSSLLFLFLFSIVVVFLFFFLSRARNVQNTFSCSSWSSTH